MVRQCKPGRICAVPCRSDASPDDYSVSSAPFTLPAEEAMKYLCLVYSEEENLHSLPESPRDAECLAYDDKVKASGHWIAGEALQPVRTATTVRVRNGRTTVTDGPFAETKEQLAGFWLIEADGLDDAIEVAAGIPAARVGSVEVRPLRLLVP
jgi:hypothetical protein